MRISKPTDLLKGKRSLPVIFTCLLFVISLTVLAPQARAFCFLCDIEQNVQQVQILNQFDKQLHEQTRREINQHTDDDFEKHEQWMLNVYFNDYWGVAMMKMAEQLSAVAMDQMMIVGTFFDAKHQMETNRLFQELAAKAHKDYHPSEGLCAIGSTAKFLGNSERNADLAAWTLSRRSMARQLMNKNGVATEGQKTDRESRIRHFLSTYCDGNDMGGNLRNICLGGVADERKNKDVDYVRTVEAPMTIQTNFNDNQASADETDLMALQANLFANETFRNSIPANYMGQRNNVPLAMQDGNLQRYLDMRAITAMRGVAQNSFNDIAGMKTANTGDEDSAKYVQAAIKQLSPGMSDDQARTIVGTNPSYDAQMEILTQKLLQDSQFYTDLYDKPANVARKGVAIQAISNIQERDNYKVTLRSEMLWSQLLELELIKAQSYVQSKMENKGK